MLGQESWCLDCSYLLNGNCALISNGSGRKRISKSDEMFHTASLIKWL